MLLLEGLRVVEFAHMVMGPACGLVLADLGAEVIKVEPLEGDNTRRLVGAGAGFYAVFNRNKKSLALDLKHAEGKEIVLKLIESADVMTENFRPGALEKMGLGYDALAKRNPRLVYCTLKGFLSGPYEHRPALGPERGTGREMMEHEQVERAAEDAMVAPMNRDRKSVV